MELDELIAAYRAQVRDTLLLLESDRLELAAARATAKAKAMRLEAKKAEYEAGLEDTSGLLEAEENLLAARLESITAELQLAKRERKILLEIGRNPFPHVTGY